MSRRQEDYVVQQARHCTNKSWGDWWSCINWCSSWWCRGTCWTTHIAAACTGHTETNRTDLIRYNYNHGQKSWDTFAFVALFSNNTCPTPPPHKQRWTRVSRLVAGFHHCIGGGRAGRREKCQIFSKRLHCIMRAPRNYRKLWILHHCPEDFYLGL